MDLNWIEVQELETVVSETDTAMRELGELELALVGGGMGDMVLG